MPIFRGPGGSGDSSTDAYASLIASYAETATVKSAEAIAAAAAALASELEAEDAEAAAIAAQIAAEAAQAVVEAIAGATANIDDLLDVTITTPADNEVLAYDTGTSEWINQTPVEAGLATAAQGALADTSVQPADIGTAAAEDVGFFATAAQGALADTATQPGDLGTAAAEDVTTSFTDTTAGRLTKVGDFGIGSTAAPEVTPAAVQPGGTYLLSDNNPEGGLSAVTLMYTASRNNDASVHLAQRVLADGLLGNLYRTQYRTSLSAWTMVYDQANSLGTVSEAAGVPTGALMEYGSNANGEYWKYAGGMMVCSRDAVKSMASATQNVQDFAFPVVFAFVPSVSMSINGGGPGVFPARESLGVRTNISTTSWNVLHDGFIATYPDPAPPLKLLAVGRWF